jgi:pimeloyl-ACP methyl ester carboxylesterase
VTTFVLVHGAWHGGWCWDRVAGMLRRNGHHVLTPTLSGLGEGRGRAPDDIGLQTHIDEVVGLIEGDRLENVVLVGHSYAGFVISGVVEMTSRVASIVFLDAFLPDDGQAMTDLGSERGREGIRAAIARGETTLPSFSAAFFAVNAADQAWVDSMCKPHPIRTFLEPVRLSGRRERIGKKTYVRTLRYPNPAFDAAVERLRHDPAWRIRTLDTGHDAMIDAPEQLAEILAEAI